MALPNGVLSGDVVLDAMPREEPGLLGPSKEFTAQLMVEEDMGGPVDLDRTAAILVLEIEEAVLGSMREYDPVMGSTVPMIPFVEDEPNALPKLRPLFPVISEWIESVAFDRLNFYSAREEQEVQFGKRRGSNSKETHQNHHGFAWNSAGVHAATDTGRHGPSGVGCAECSELFWCCPCSGSRLVQRLQEFLHCLQGLHMVQPPSWQQHSWGPEQRLPLHCLQIMWIKLRFPFKGPTLLQGMEESFQQYRSRAWPSPNWSLTWLGEALLRTLQEAPL